MLKCSKPIAILMATYNGEHFLREQLDSILQQSSNEWHLYVHDDGSIDATVAILQEYAHLHPDLITVVEYPSQGGACRNFLSLLNLIEAEYYMFSDQDDIWLSDKIEVCINEMRLQETSFSSSPKPIIISTDLRVVDENLDIISSSLWEIAGIYPDRIHTFDDMAANTIVTGCTMLINNRAKQSVMPMTNNTTMHDAWIACCVMKKQGVITCIPKQTILYRQHGSNTYGAQDVVHRSFMQKILDLNKSWQINKSHYLMLQDLQYGGIAKFIWHKWKYRRA